MKFINEFFTTYMQYIFNPLHSLIYSFVSNFNLTFNQRNFIVFSLIFFTPILLLNIKFAYKVIASLGLSAICIAVYEAFKERGYIDINLPTKIVSYILLILVVVIFLHIIKKLFR